MYPNRTPSLIYIKIAEANAKWKKDQYENVGIGVPVPEPGKIKPPVKKN